jgi:phage shock protein E
MPTEYIFPGIIIAYIAWQIAWPLLVRRRLPGLLAQDAQVVDVRSAAEFAGGHVPGSINIPLPEISDRTRELDRDRWVIVCCASGTRSAIAKLRLRSLGFRRVVNAGPWTNLP